MRAESGVLNMDPIDSGKDVENPPTNIDANPQTTLNREPDGADSVSPTLRWWPAAVILFLMAAASLGPSLFESPPLPILMFQFMGPAA
ncbi:MAG: hypothetical protein AAF745_17965, partial [Planctomycetota bacterium]